MRVRAATGNKLAQSSSRIPRNYYYRCANIISVALRRENSMCQWCGTGERDGFTMAKCARAVFLEMTRGTRASNPLMSCVLFKGQHTRECARNHNFRLSRGVTLPAPCGAGFFLSTTNLSIQMRCMRRVTRSRVCFRKIRLARATLSLGLPSSIDRLWCVLTGSSPSVDHPVAVWLSRAIPVATFSQRQTRSIRNKLIGLKL